MINKIVSINKIESNLCINSLKSFPNKIKNNMRNYILKQN